MNPMQPSRVVRRGVAAGLVAIALAAGYDALVRSDAPPQLPVLHASVSASPDSDGDGLPDVLEANLGTSPDRQDSDGDGFWDAEEIARQSDPNDKKDVPISIPASVGLGIYEKGSVLHPVAVVYVADGDIRNVNLMMGVRVGTQLRDLPSSFFSKNSSLAKAPSFNSKSKVLVYDMTMSSQHVRRFGDLSVYSKMNYRGSIISADALNMWVSGGVIVESSITGFHSPSPEPNLTSLSPGQGTTGVYQPLGGGSSTAPPPNWQSGKICAQSMVVVGVVGSVVIQEVVNAGCEAGWESFCDSSSCSGTVGSTVNMVDPVALVGG